MVVMRAASPKIPRVADYRNPSKFNPTLLVCLCGDVAGIVLPIEPGSPGGLAPDVLRSSRVRGGYLGVGGSSIALAARGHCHRAP